MSVGEAPSGAQPSLPGPLPYPHARNDCEMCRERDADFHVLGEEFNQPGKRPLLLCRKCLGEFAVVRVIYCQRDGQPWTLSLEPAGLAAGAGPESAR